MKLHAPLLAAALLIAPATAPAAITSDNVSTLVQQWQVETGGISGGPILAHGTLYVPSWDSMVYALDPLTGAQKWATRVGGPIPGPVLATSDGGICYGTLAAQVGCLDADDGGIRWQKNLREPQPGAIWSGLAEANGRLFVGVASVSDVPCTRGRLVALDLADGDELWRFYTVPEKVCDTDTAQECTADEQCPGDGTCVPGIGGGVTATVALDPTGEWVYMNTVGCYTSPSIGESDSMFKIEAGSGDVVWRKRVNDPEQYGFCREDSSVDCGIDDHCASVGGGCSYAENPRVPKSNYHDFGFLNGPLYVDLPADGPLPAKKLIISASKNGTLYAFDEATGDIAWTNVVQPTPITPGFAGFGLFNGPIAYADGRIHAALNNMFPWNLCDNGLHQNCNTSADCDPGGTCIFEPEHRMTFDARDGSTLWSAEIGRSWSAVGVYDGVSYAGKNGSGDFFAHDAATGELLHTFQLPRDVSARALVANDMLYVAWGVSNPGGVRAYGFCGNGVVDAGEPCDSAAAGTLCCSSTCQILPDEECEEDVCGNGTLDDGEACDPAIAGTVCCTDTCQLASNVACDDGNTCSAPDQCVEGVCTGAIVTTEQMSCSLGDFEGAPCGDEALPRSLTRLISKRLKRARNLLGKAVAQSTGGRAQKAEKLRTQAIKQVDAIGRKAAKAATVGNASRRISEECAGTLDGLVASNRELLRTLPLR